MHILSSEVKSDLESNNMEERWYPKEWEWAQQRYEDETKISGKLNFKTIFVAIGDYRFSESYHHSEG